MTMRKIIIRFCNNIESSVRKICNEINIRAGGFLFCVLRVEFSKINKRDVTFIREMRVPYMNRSFETTLDNKPHISLKNFLVYYIN